MVALAVAGIGVFESFLGTEVQEPWIVGPTMLAVAGALVLRRVQPYVTLFVALMGLAIADRFTVNGSAASTLGAVAAFASAGLELRMPRLLYGPLVLGIFAAVMMVGISDRPSEPIDVIAVTIMYGGSLAAGVMFRQRMDRVAELAAHAARLEQERETKAREAVDAERARIARELHDIVSHSISVIVVQTQAVRRMLGAEHRQQSDDLRAVETVGRQAMAEMRRMLGVLRAGPGRIELEPQPGLGQLPRLLEQTRAAGLPVDLAVEGQETPLPPGVDLAAYRIIQEALTNVMKHAGPATAVVTVGYRDRELDIRIEDDGQRPIQIAPGGNGLVGMRERVAVYGGRLDFGAVSERSFQVSAHLPIREEALLD